MLPLILITIIKHVIFKSIRNKTYFTRPMTDVLMYFANVQFLNICSWNYYTITYC